VDAATKFWGSAMARSRLLLIVLVVCLVIVVIYTTNDYFKQNAQQKSLQQQIDTANQTLALLPQPVQDLPQKLTDAQAAYQSISTPLTANPDPNLLIKKLFLVSDQLHLEVNPVSTDQWVQRTIGGSTYWVMPLYLDIVGPFPDLLAFLTRLQDKSEFPALQIEKSEMISLTPAKKDSLDPLTLKLTLSLVKKLEAGK
jgi:hypothetical protein